EPESSPSARTIPHESPPRTRGRRERSRSLANARSSAHHQVGGFTRLGRAIPGRLLRRRLRRTDRSLTRGQTGGFDTERRTAHVVEPELVTEDHGCRVAPVLAADPDVEARVRRPALLPRDAHEAPHPRLVDRDERVGGHELALLVHADELADVVAAEPERRLREVVGSEREELGGLGDLARGYRRARELDHRAPLEVV